jgi:hypothetical protein
MDHPLDQDKYLVHTCLEGPEDGVYYRGRCEIVNNHSGTITLPDYVDKIASGFSVQVTRIYSDSIKKCSVSNVVNNQFTVYGENGAFFWMVYGMRNEIVVEPNKSDVTLKGTEPYHWLE